ncbi:alanine--tRNA ligase [Candidatus Parvarchaeota archaeon]|nr:alanine--tRNA ligase [Candidatus Parvarchaeota archaeon]
MDREKAKEIIRKRLSESPKSLIPYASLVKMGFSRKKCSSCGKNFWTSSDTNICGDAECVGTYTFLQKTPSALNLSYTELWKRFSSMFKKFGHKEINRYPVVARWRDDIYYVEAAIDDFAPYVINGSAEPPANPLVVPQICFRFNDINNVGLSGRHLTSFVMAEEAAFNTKKKKTYFDNEAIKYIFQWINKGMKIKKEDVTFVEDAWAGAGYAGSCLEFFLGGLELGNQVYMRYLLSGDLIKDLPTKTIDMGAGLERWAWVSLKTPTLYEATFPKVVNFIKDKAGVEYDEETIRKIYAYLGDINFEKYPLEKVIPKLSKEIGMEQSKISRILGDMRAIYSIADHTRTLLVAIHDGSLPSNVGGGYNLRNIFRRAAGFIDSKNWKISINEVIDQHKNEFGEWFKELKETRTEEVIQKEMERYEEFRIRTKKLVASVVSTGKIDRDKMRQLYESKGITIDDIRQEAETQGKAVELPEDFYTEINTQKQKSAEMTDTELDGLPKTQKMFYDEKLLRTSAKIIKKIGGNGLVLDKTIFYPEMGGQKPDLGKINGVEVTDVKIKNDIIIHYLKKELGLKAGSFVKLEVDQDRRELLRKHHTATHIINQAARRVLGEFVFQNGAEKDVDKAHLDITYFDRIDPVKLNEIEALANKVVSDDLDINVTVLDRTKAEMKYGMSIYQGGAIPNSKLRIVNIGDYDVEACGGLHCHRSGEVGLIKIVKSEKIQDGVVRLVFKAYTSALRYVQEQDSIIKALSNMWGVTPGDIVKTACRFFSDAKRFRDKYEDAETERLIMSIKSMSKTGKEIEVSTGLENVGKIISAVMKTGLGKETIIIKTPIGVLAMPKEERVKKLLESKYSHIIDKGSFFICNQ